MNKGSRLFRRFLYSLSIVLNNTPFVYYFITFIKRIFTIYNEYFNEEYFDVFPYTEEDELRYIKKSLGNNYTIIFYDYFL